MCLSLVCAAGCKPSITSGWIEYDHTLTNSYGDFEQTVRVTGTVGFLSSNAALSPQGAMYSGSGSNTVALNGNELFGKLYFNTTETWYSTMTYSICSTPAPLPSQTIQQRISFPLENGAVFEQPYIGAAGSGTYRWILHIEDL